MAVFSKATCGVKLASNKEKKKAINETRKARRDQDKEQKLVESGGIRVNRDLLAHSVGYGREFNKTGFYRDFIFQCVSCGDEQIWTATEQKWWYESAKGSPYSTATLCRRCRKKKRLLDATRKILGEKLGVLDAADGRQLVAIAELYLTLDKYDKALEFLRRGKNRLRDEQEKDELEARIKELQNQLGKNS